VPTSQKDFQVEEFEALVAKLMLGLAAAASVLGLVGVDLP
jgi:hypothetical protein